MELLESKYQKIKYRKEHRLLFVEWINTAEMTDKEYREELLKQIVEIEKHQVQKMLLDTSKFEFSISPQTQDWNNKNILSRVIAVGLKKAALLLTEDLFGQISIEQNMEEEKTGAFAIRYFQTLEDAMQWLIK